MKKSDAIRLEPLGGGLEIYISGACSFGTDAVLLADFAAPKPGDAACDLGTGCGIIPLLWQKGSGPAHTVGVEIQPEACLLAERSVDRNGCGDRIQIANADLRYLPAEWKGGFDLITCNPPYFTDKFRKSPDPLRAAARTEGMCTLWDVLSAAERLLRPSGRFCFCQRPGRLEEAMRGLVRAGLYLNRLRFISHRPEKPPFLFLAEAGRRPGFSLLPHLFLETDGEPSAEYKRIYRDFFPASPLH
ncbi:MAG TPA: methyltransferase [Firmicutes bacterium]|nr:methyltransferase [Bacillota bacterium]